MNINKLVDNYINTHNIKEINLSILKDITKYVNDTTNTNQEVAYILDILTSYENLWKAGEMYEIKKKLKNKEL